MSPCLTLSIIRYGSSEKWCNPGKKVHLGVVANEKGAFVSPSTTVGNITYLQGRKSFTDSFYFINTEKYVLGSDRTKCGKKD